MKMRTMMLALIAGLAMTSAHAADNLPVKTFASIGSGYPSTKCGMYYGLNSMGSAGAVNGAAVGTQVVQGDIGVTLGYSCPLSSDGGTFAFVDGMFDFSNLNGNTNGLALSGPATFEQRVGFGSPISSMLNLFPSLSFPALPSLPTLPSGVTAGPAYPYLFASLHEQDISATVGLGSNKEWLISPGIGIGAKIRLSNNVVFDPFAEWQMRSNSVFVGPVKAAQLGNLARVGFALEY